MSDPTLKVGLVGVGGRGAPILANLLDVRQMTLQCICDVDQEYIRKALQKHPCNVCATYDEMLAYDVDAVLLILPNFLHEEYTVKAAAAGKHVFVEKPIANRLDEAERMIAAGREHGVVLAVGHSARYGRQNTAMGELIEQGALGDICGFYACTAHDNAKGTARRWKTDARLAPCPPLMQLGIHSVDTLRSYFGEVEAVYSRHASVNEQFDMTDTTHTLLRFASGLVGSVSCYYMVPKSRVWNFYGIAGRAVTQGSRIEILREGASDPEYIDIAEPSPRPGDARMLGDFAAAVLNGKPFPVDGLAGAKNLAVVWAAIYSSEQGREVTIEETLRHYGATYLID